MKISPAGVALIKEFEGFVGHPYRDAVGVWTIGYGHTEDVGPRSPRLTQVQATALLAKDLDRKYAPPVNALRVKLTQSQFDALVSLVYNCGPGAISASSTIGAALRRGDMAAAANGFLLWTKAGGRTLAGLVRRRKAERALFLSRTPTADDPLAGYQDDEIKAIRTYDDWRRRNVNLAGRKRLRADMRTMARRIEAAAKADGKNGWAKNRRRERFRSLHARTT
jgi:lysozyme